MIQYFSLLMVLVSATFTVHAGQVTAQQFVDLQQGDSMHPGFRRAHAKGMCISGEFHSNGALSKFSEATIFKLGRSALLGRVSIAGNNPYAPDLKAPVRSMALLFNSEGAQQWRIAMNTPPVMAVTNVDDFYQQIVAIKQGPAAIKAFFKAHPESADFIAWKERYQSTSSFALEAYHSINAFYLVDENNTKQAVRWAFQPSTSSSASGQKLTGNDALFEELQQRLSHGPVAFDWVFTLADAQDDEHNPAKRWPASREQIVAGTVTITDWQAQQGGRCDGMNFDPTVLPKGIALTNDPILRARSAAYAESYRRRAVEQLRGQAKEISND